MKSRLRASFLCGAVFAVAGPVLGLASAAVATTTHTPYQTGRVNSGTPNSTNVVRNPTTGAIESYGDSAITYTAPSPTLKLLGQSLFLENCASCHGKDGMGNGPAAAAFQ